MNQRIQKILIISLFAIVFIMFVGYSAFSSKMEIKGIARANTSWNVAIESIAVNEAMTKGRGSNISTVIENGGLIASFQSSLLYPGDIITYDVTVANKGIIDAKLDDIVFEQRNIGDEAKEENLSGEQLVINPIIYHYSGISKDEVLLADHKTTFQVTVQYNPDVDKTPLPEQMKSTSTIILSYIQNTNE